jgi:hypothetical protein
MVATTTILVLSKKIDPSANFVAEKGTSWWTAGIALMRILLLMVSMEVLPPHPMESTPTGARILVQQITLQANWRN